MSFNDFAKVAFARMISELTFDSGIKSMLFKKMKNADQSEKRWQLWIGKTIYCSDEINTQGTLTDQQMYCE